MNPEDYIQDQYDSDYKKVMLQQQVEMLKQQALYNKYTSKDKTMEEMRKLIEEFQNSMGETAQKTICRMCGETNPRRDSFAVRYNCCGKCMEKVMAKIFGDMISSMIPENGNYCQDCKSHLNACHCPKSEAMRKIKR